MATVVYVARQRKRAKVDELTVGSSTVGHTFTTTAGVKAVTYTAVSGDTTATIAAALLALLQASTEGEYTELDFAAGSTTSKIRVTGPDDGAPFTLAVSGTGTFSTTTLTAPLSPSDLGDGLNYSTGALPSASDALVFEDSDADAKYNAAALTAIGLASVTRRASFTGRLGLPALNENGYPEYRAQEVEFDAPLQLYEVAQGDAAGQVRVKSVGAAAVTLTVQGDGSTAAVGDEVVEVRGLPAASVVRVNGASLSVAALAGHVATIGTLLAQNATLWLGSGVTLANPTYTNCTVRQDCSSTTLTTLEGGSVDVRGSAAVGNAGLKVYKGAVTWRSTGATGNSPLVGGGGALDFSQAPNGVAVGGTVALYPGATWNDPAGKCGSYTVQAVNCTLADVSLNVGTNKTLAVS